ncbi:MAG: lipopolysaccharide heptosyltransferase II [Candidatus Omnitrophota bacterium]
MKILQILPELNIGGVERGCVDLARELVRRGHQAFVISNGGRLVQELETGKVKHFALPVHKKSLFSIIYNIPKVAKILREERIDIVHARSRIPALIAFFACRRSSAVFITTCHGYYSKSFFSRVMGWAKIIIVASDAVFRHMNEDFGVPRERLRLIPRGVDLGEFQFKPTRPGVNSAEGTLNIGVVGRLTPIKGHKYFLQAFSRMIRDFPHARALVAGEISPGRQKYKEELLRLSRELGLEKTVRFVGAQDNIPQFLTELDVLVLPTITQEAFGRVLIEAGACGVPVVATKVGGIVDIIQDGENGILVEPGNAAALAGALIKLAKNPQLGRQMAWLARKKVENSYSLQRMVDKTINVYNEALAVLKILVIKWAALGDIILISPSLRALREKFPQAHISVLVASSFKALLESCPYVNQVIELDVNDKSYKNVWHISILLRKYNFDMVVDLQNNKKSHLAAYLSGCNKRYGYDNGKFSFLLNKRVKEDKFPLSPVKHQARALGLLGITDVKEDLELWTREEDCLWAENFLAQFKKKNSAPLVGINPGSSAAWISKRWPVQKFAALLEKIHDEGMEIVVTGKDEDSVIVTRLKKVSRVPFIDAVGLTSIGQMACLIKHCSVYVTSDSAPLHISYAVQTPVVALFGPTDPRRHTLDYPAQVIIRKDLDCSPCYRRICPGKHHCMNDISVECVFAAVKKLLK